MPHFSPWLPNARKESKSFSWTVMRLPRPEILLEAILIVCDYAYSSAAICFLGTLKRISGLPWPNRIISVGSALTTFGFQGVPLRRVLGSKLTQRHLCTLRPVKSLGEMAANWASGAAHFPRIVRFRQPSSLKGC
jgi:hypothetical protein